MGKKDARKEIGIAICIAEMNIAHILKKYKKDSTREIHIAKELDDLERDLKTLIDGVLDGNTKED